MRPIAFIAIIVLLLSALGTADAQIGGTMLARQPLPKTFATCDVLQGNAVQLQGNGTDLCE